MPLIRVLLVDDHDVIRGGLRALLDRHPHINVGDLRERTLSRSRSRSRSNRTSS